MAKNELIESAKQLEQRINELMERVKQLHSDVGSSLQQAKRQESKLIEKEKAEAKARAEREKAERLKEILESDEQKGVYFGGHAEEQEPVKDTSSDLTKPAEESEKPAAEVKPAQPEPAKPVVSGETSHGEGKRPQRQDNRPDGGYNRNEGRRDNRGEQKEGRPQNKPQPRGEKPYGERPQGGQQRPRSGVSVPAPQPPQNRQHENKSQYVRTFDNDKKQKNKKTLMKEAVPSANWSDDDNTFGNRRKAKKQQA